MDCGEVEEGWRSVRAESTEKEPRKKSSSGTEGPSLKQQKMTSIWRKATKEKNLKQQAVELKETDNMPSVAEDSQPRRQYKEDMGKLRKPAGRKRKHEQNISSCINWFLLWNSLM